MKLWILIAFSTIFLTATVNAKVVSIIDWEGGFSNRVNDEDAKNCREECPGYSTSVTSCDIDETLVSCSVSGCSNYKQCQ